jgi:hypothetical protein
MMRPATTAGEAEVQRARFERLADAFADRLAAVEPLGDPAFTRADWARRNRELRAFLLPRPPWDFLHHPAILHQMFVGPRYLAHELPYVLGRAPDARLLTEDAVGDPPLTALDGRGWTSSNTVHHLHHLLRYEDATGRRLGDVATVVEWGAGYGNLAKLLLRLHGGSPTCVLVDTPVFSALQWLYLSCVAGADRVVLHSERGAPVSAGRVNLVPVGLVRDLAVDADLFVSTWALNESTPAAQRLVTERRFFGADGVLVAMHRGDPLEPVVLDHGLRPIPVGDFMPAQRYFVR